MEERERERRGAPKVENVGRIYGWYTRSRLQCNRSLGSVDITWALSRRGVAWRGMAWSSPDIYQVLR